MKQLKVTKQSSKVMVILLLLISVHTAYAASTKPASVLLQEGLYAEEVEGNLDEAIKIYQQIISASQQTEQAAAQATYRIGLCYLKKSDNKNAAKHFQQLISKFPKQESLVKEAQKQLEKLNPLLSFAFSPVIQLDIPCFDVSNATSAIGKSSLIDFETSKLLSQPKEYNSRDKSNDLKNWLIQNKIDAGAFDDGKFTKLGQEWHDKDLFVKISNTSWDNMSPKEVEDSYQKGTGADDTRYEEFPATYIFKTLEGNFVLLQILSATDENIKIRYKMLIHEREIFLPDADDVLQQGKVAVILDLSTGKMLPGNSDKQYFIKLKEGDVAYSDDEGKDVLAGFRGAKITRKLENGQYSDTPDQSHTDTNMNLYVIKIPSDMFITTKEGDTYELKILSKLSKGLNIKYAKVPQQQLAKKTGDPQTAAKMIAPLYGMFSSAYEALIKNNDPNTAQAMIEIAIPQFEKFESLMEGTDSAQAFDMAMQMVRELNTALKNGEIEKAKSLINAIDVAGPGLGKMVEEEASKAESALKKNK